MRDPHGRDLRSILGLDHPFFRPLWRRIAVVAVCLGWAVVEFATGGPFWGMLFGGLGLYGAWGFFVAPGPGAAPEETGEEKE